LPFREGALFEMDGHDHDHDHGHGHDDAKEGAAFDPHIWLDPDNARLFLEQIAAELAVLDPDNAQTYAENARLGGDAILTIDRQIAGQLEPLRGTPFIVLHDGFHYFEAHYEIEAIGAISPSDAQTPGAARIKELRAALPDSRLRCAFAEPETGGRLIETVTEGLEVRTAVLDPLGTDLTLGPTLYTELLAKMGQAMQECLAP
jgi:zinc transport system substrate-binding protein